MTSKQTYQTPAQGGEQCPIECSFTGGGIEFWRANGGHIVHPVCKTRPGSHLLSMPD